MSFQKDFLSKKITDPLAKIVSDLAKQEYQQNFQTQNIDSLNVQILSIKTKTKTLSKDKFHVSVKSYNPDQRFYNAVYPDRNKMKLWLKGENSDKLQDYALLNHNAHLWSAYQVAEQYQRDDPNNMAGHEIVSYANNTHYIHVEDRRDLRISDLIVDEPTSPGFSIIVRYNPLTYGDSNQESLIIDQKIDSSQNRYGHSVNVDDEGNIYFYVKYNYRQYFVKMSSPISLATPSSNFAPENYKPENFKTEPGVLIDATTKSYDLACEFNYTTKECIIKLVYDGEIIASVSSLTGTGSLPSNIQLYLPLQEGEWSETKTLPNNLPLAQVFDSSPNQLVGTVFNVNSNGVWQDDNTLKNDYKVSDGTFFIIPNHASLNNMTEVTVCCWVKKDALISHAGSYAIFSKGWASGTEGAVELGYLDSTNAVYFGILTNEQTWHNISIDNVFQGNDEYVFLAGRWKSGEKIKLSINNGTEVFSPVNFTNTVIINTNGIIHGQKTTDFTIINMMVFNRQLTPTEITTVYNYGAHLSQFPKNLEPQRLVNPSPPPVTNPVVTIYDLPKLSSPTINDYTFINNPSTQSPFIEKYNVPDGVAGGTPVTTIYNIAPGTGGTTTNPFATIYSLPGASSTGQIQYSSTASSNEWGYVQYIETTGSNFYTKKPTEIQVWLNGLDNPTGGTVWLGIIKNDGTKIKFGTSIDPTTLPDAWTSYTKQLLTNTYALAVNDGIGVIWEGGTGGSVNVRRGGSGVHVPSESTDGSHGDKSCQGGRRGSGIGEWKTPNPDFSMAGTIKTGGDTTGTSPHYSFKNVTGNNYLIGEYFPSGSPMLGQVPTRVEFRVYRDVAATNGTVSIRHVKADGSFYPTLYEVNTSSLPDINNIPTTFNFVWENLDYSNPILISERIAVVSNGLTTGNAYVLSNIGNSGTTNSYDTTRSFLNYRSFNGVWGSATTIDLSGVIKKGGNTFTGLMKFSPTVTRIYERAVTTNSLFYDQPLSKIVPRGKRTGTIPSPSMMTARLRSNANVEKAVLGTFDANSIGTVLGDIPFINNNNTVKVAVGDYVSIEIATCDAANYIELSISNVAYNAGDSLLGTLTSGVIGDLAAYDLSGKFYIGGQIDNVSRPRVSQYIDTQDSIFLTVPNNRITEVKATLVAVGAPSGLVYINIRRGFDDALIFSLGSVSAGSIGTALTGTTITIQNYNNTYILSAKDKISIEYEGGDGSNKIGVQIRSGTNYDGANSYVARYNGIEYDYLTAADLAATMKVGGDTYQPDPNAPPPVLPQNPTDLYILSAINKRESSFVRCIFGMYLFFNTLLTDQELLQFNITRIDTGNNLPNEIQVTNHSFFRNE